MREYKPVYGISLIVVSLEMLLCFLGIGCSIGIIYRFRGEMIFGEILGGTLTIGIILVVFCVLLTLLINMIARPFSRKRAVLTEFTLEYEGKVFQLQDIRYITLYLPEAGRHNTKPQVLTIWADEKHYVDIKRPSIDLIAQLKKTCPYAAFDVDDWKGRLRNSLLAALIMAFIIPVLFFLDPEHK